MLVPGFNLKAGREKVIKVSTFSPGRMVRKDDEKERLSGSKGPDC